MCWDGQLQKTYFCNNLYNISMSPRQLEIRWTLLILSLPTQIVLTLRLELVPRETQNITNQYTETIWFLRANNWEPTILVFKHSRINGFDLDFKCDVSFILLYINIIKYSSIARSLPLCVVLPSSLFLPVIESLSIYPSSLTCIRVSKMGYFRPLSQNSPLYLFI